MRATVLVDLGFGDAGKGLFTDYFARAGAGLVVRYNGGAQAGHNVVTPDGRHHTFSQLGAGTFVAGVRTFLSRHMVVHPTALLVEARALAEQGVGDALERLRVSESALLVTPYHQAANRLRELARGAARHGSCGVGVGEAVEAALAEPQDRLVAGDLRQPEVCGEKLARAREQVRLALRPILGALPASPALERERAALDDDGVGPAWLERARALAATGVLAPDEALADELARVEACVFEGAQGVLLDATRGFLPHVSWSRCTLDDALELLRDFAPQAQVERLGLLRTHAVRHGAGPLPTESGTLAGLVQEHNADNPWQGPVRYGHFDGVLARYAVEVVGRLDALALTHCDLLSRLPEWTWCRAYRLSPAPSARRQRELSAAVAELLKPNPRGPDGLVLAAEPAPSLGRQRRLGELLSVLQPVLETCPPVEAEVTARLAAHLGRPVAYRSRGPTAEHVQRSA